MREIRFRAWDVSTGSGIMLDSVECSQLTIEDLVRTTIPMLYIGMVDSNGCEIYEDDIVKITEGYFDYEDNVDVFPSTKENIYLRRVKWDARYGFMGLLRDEPDGGSPVQIEVIGNIHQNPELLEANDER